jgi:hypothetical protein
VEGERVGRRGAHADIARCCRFGKRGGKARATTQAQTPTRGVANALTFMRQGAGDQLDFGVGIEQSDDSGQNQHGVIGALDCVAGGTITEVGSNPERIRVRFGAQLVSNGCFACAATGMQPLPFGERA